MKLDGGVNEAGREYPYLVTRVGSRYSQRGLIDLRGNRPAANGVPIPQPRIFDADGNLYEHARPLLIAATEAQAAEAGLHMCLVWGPESCTFVSPNGQIDHSDVPPSSSLSLMDGRVDLTPIEIEPCFSIALPSAEEPDRFFLCAKRTGDLVEIMLGEHMVLGELPDADEPIPAELDPDGKLARLEDPWQFIAEYRGQAVSKIDGDTILGPVQPIQGQEAITLYDPWKHEVAAACEQVAGGVLSPFIIGAVWEEVRPRRQDWKIAA